MINKRFFLTFWQNKFKFVKRLNAFSNMRSYAKVRMGAFQDALELIYGDTAIDGRKLYLKEK